MASNDDLILGMLQEIRDDQREANKTIQKLILDHTNIINEMRSARNGFSPSEIAEMLHWVKRTMSTEDKTSDKIREKIIDWSVPILISALVLGLVVIGGKFL